MTARDSVPEATATAAAAHALTARSHAEVTALTSRLSLVAPGVVPVSEWRPDHAPLRADRADMYAGLATISGRNGISRRIPDR